VTIQSGLGIPTERVGNQHPFTAPYDAFEASDGWIVIGTASNKLFGALCDAIARPELKQDERFRNHRKRAANRILINGIVGVWVAARSCEAVLRALGPEGADVPCAQVARPGDLVDDDQLLARDMIERHPHPSIDEVVFHGNPLRFSGAESRALALAPDLGADNREVFAEIGLEAADLERLLESGVI
jgi:crotonobetainyl-CoA:carnitine CoA-transferase CaiB-like acyl-CoA transferase